MRKILLLPLVLWACGGAKEAPPAEAPAAMPAALTAADVVGSYTGTTMANGTDSVLSTWTSMVALSVFSMTAALRRTTRSYRLAEVHCCRR